MPIFKKTQKHSGGKFFITLDIGTEMVKALVCSAEGDRGRILGVGRQKQKLGDISVYSTYST